MPDHGRRRRSAARLLAPLALLLVAGAVGLVVQRYTGPDEDDGGDTAGRTIETPPPRDGTRQQPPRRKFYRVKLNDTLGLIAEKTDVPVERIQELNPELDPQNLVVGQRIRLRE